jgi:hypothetical protein
VKICMHANIYIYSDTVCDCVCVCVTTKFRVMKKMAECLFNKCCYHPETFICTSKDNKYMEGRKRISG